jgi:hypothetical protein
LELELVTESQLGEVEMKPPMVQLCEKNVLVIQKKKCNI